MSRQRIMLLGGAVLCAAILFAGGFLFGTGQAADATDVEEAGQEAYADAYRSALPPAWAGGLKRGLSAGEAVGQLDGLARGRREGREDALSVLVKSGQGIRSESRKDIGYDGGDRIELEGSGEVLVVGDSLEVLSSPYLKQYLPGVKLEINVVGGYNSFQIFDLFQESYSPSQSVIVFDSGTNDNPAHPEILAGRLQAVEKIIGNRCMVVPTIHGFTVNGIDNTGKNRVVRSFAASRPGTQTPDWAGVVRDHPELMQADDLHPIPEGADLRAQIIADGIQACLSGVVL